MLPEKVQHTIIKLRYIPHIIKQHNTDRYDIGDLLQLLRFPFEFLRNPFHFLLSLQPVPSGFDKV
ncbi:hypothetical protein D3C75_1068240 [compost metagenome]